MYVVKCFLHVMLMLACMVAWPPLGGRGDGSMRGVGMVIHVMLICTQSCGAGENVIVNNTMSDF